MPGDITVLLTSAGRRVELLRSFRYDAEALGVTARLIACDVDNRWSAACQAADESFAVPPCTDPAYPDAVLDGAVRLDVDLVIPTIDPELAPLAHSRQRFAMSGIDLVVSAPDFVAIARDKLTTAQRLQLAGVRTPATATPVEVAHRPEDWRWPLIAKPRDGSASSGLALLQGPDELRSLDPGRSWVVQERLKGIEYTANMLIDRQGQLVVTVPHERRRVRAGEVEKGITVRDAGLLAAAGRIAAGLEGGRGPICFQAFGDETCDPAVFEINARFGGGYPLSHASGAAFGRWLIADRLGLALPDLSGWRAGVAMLRYDAALFPTDLVRR